MKITPAILCAFLFLAAGYVFGGTLSQAEITELFEEGKSLFRQANSMADENPHESRQLMQKALLRFQRLVDEGGIRNGRLYYDLGNIHFHLDDLGQAILNYRRAMEYIPDDANLQQNLSYARSQREDAFAEPEQQKILKTLFFWHYDFTLRTRSMLFISIFLATWILLAVRLFSRSASLTRLIVAAGALALLFLVSVVLTQIRQRSSNPVRNRGARGRGPTERQRECDPGLQRSPPRRDRVRTGRRPWQVVPSPPLGRPDVLASCRRNWPCALTLPRPPATFAP